MPKSYLWTIALLMTLVIAGCKDRTQPAAESPSTPTPKAAPIADTVTDKWLGKWIGPEGTYLVLSKNAEKYAVEINSLDGSTRSHSLELRPRLVVTVRSAV